MDSDVMYIWFYRSSHLLRKHSLLLWQLEEAEHPRPG